MPDLVTLEDVKEEGEISGAQLDGRILRRIDSVTASAEAYCMRTFALATHTEHHDIISNPSFFYVNSPPWVSITTLTHNEQVAAVTIDADEDVIDETEYKDAGLIELFNGESVFYSGDASVKIVYSGGWDEETFPADLKEALVSQILFELDHRERIGIASQSADGVSVSYDEVSGFASQVKVVLDRYRRLDKLIV